MIRVVVFRTLHVSWIIAFTCVGIVGGVALAAGMHYFASIAWLLTGLALLAAAALRAKNWVIPIAIIGGVFIGLWRGSSIQIDLAAYDHYVGGVVVASGTVVEDIDKNQRGQLVIRLKDISLQRNDVKGMLWVTTSASTILQRSDNITVKGKLSDGFGSFSGSIYSAQITNITRPEPGDIPLKVRDYFASGVRKALSDTEASLGLGYIVGQRRGLPQELDTALQAAGLTHIVVASGYNLTILVRLARRLFEKISKYLSLIASLMMIVGFIGVTGLSPSMSRAGLVAGLSLLAWYYGRRFHPLILLPFAMAITVIIQPSYAWGDLGWQLSFAAFAGVMILAPLFQAYFFGDKEEKTLRRIFIETISATIATLPILISSFGQFSVIAPLANMLILPLVPIAMALTFIAGLGGIMVPALATAIGLPAQLILTYMTSTAQFMGSLPWALQEAELPVTGVVIAYTLIVLACIYMSLVTKYDLRKSSLVE